MASVDALMFFPVSEFGATLAPVTELLFNCGVPTLFFGN
jgi:hypothetical protein